MCVGHGFRVGGGGGYFHERAPITFNHGALTGLQELEHGWKKEGEVDINKIKELFGRKDIQYIAIAAIQRNDESTTECTVYARELLHPPIDSPENGYIRLKFSSETLQEVTIRTNTIVNLYYKDK